MADEIKKNEIKKLLKPYIRCALEGMTSSLRTFRGHDVPFYKDLSKNIFNQNLFLYESMIKLGKDEGLSFPGYVSDFHKIYNKYLEVTKDEKVKGGRE